MFQDKIRSLLAELSATWLKRRIAPATAHKGVTAANDIPAKRPRQRKAHRPGKPVDRASNM
jgi:hypothetical protein